MSNKGSLWAKWDLHIHTPASFHWSGKKFTDCNQSEREILCKQILDRMNEVDVIAFCVMDYWTFDGYITLREYISRNPGLMKKAVFPGIELRMESPTSYRLNTHVLLSDEVSPELLRHFLSRLKLGGVDGKPPSRETFIEIARDYDGGKLRHHGYRFEDHGDDSKMLELGMKTAEVTRESLKEAMEIVGRNRCLLVQPFDTSDGLSGLNWKEHPYSDARIMKWADCFETRSSGYVDLFLGFGIPGKPHIGEEFLHNMGGNPKPVFSGSDAHEISNYGIYPSNRITWLKAQPSFKGLQQVCHEPALRCFIGEQPPKLKHVDENPTKYIRELRLSKVEGSSFDENWFHGKRIEFNSGLVAIIGNKGSGKSALADILALAGNSHCSKMEFLNKDRFRGNNNKAQHFNAQITWNDGSVVNVNLGNDADKRMPERVRYLPQHFIENLCNEIASGNDTNFGRELKKVIFSHIAPEHRLRTGTLDELLDYQIESHDKAFSQIYEKLRTLNETIARNEQESSEDSIKSYKNALALKQSELDAIDAVPIPVVDQPSDTANDEQTQLYVNMISENKKELESLQRLLADSITERQGLNGEQATLNRLIGHLNNFESLFADFVSKHTNEFEDAGLVLEDILKLTIDKSQLTLASDRAKTRISELTDVIEGRKAADSNQDEPGLQDRISRLQKELPAIQDGLDAPHKAYQLYLKAIEERAVRRSRIIGNPELPDTIDYYNGRIHRATEVLPFELIKMRDERRNLVRKLHEQLLAKRQAYESLYAPVQLIATDAATSTDSIQLEFDALIADSGFETNFLDFIHKGRRGTFFGDEESRLAVQDLIRAHDFDDTDSVVSFTDAVLDALSHVSRDGNVEEVAILSQLRDKKKLTALYDYIFGLDYLEIRYDLRLGGKTISKLSPGEKGALLLVFYLLLDTEEIPIIIDQPEHNLDNESVVKLLVACIRKARTRRQVVIVTHNPNLAVYCDADQVICCTIDKLNGNRIDYQTGAIEDYDINRFAVNVLEGTYPAFDNRRKKWHKPSGLS